MVTRAVVFIGLLLAATVTLMPPEALTRLVPETEEEEEARLRTERIGRRLALELEQKDENGTPKKDRPGWIDVYRNATRTGWP